MTLAETVWARPLEPAPEYRAICQRLAQRLPRVHLLHLDMGDQISSRAWTNLITSLDFERLFFLQADIARFRESEVLLDDALRAGDMNFAFEVTSVFKERFSNRVDYIGTLLEQGFDWTTDETHSWDRKEAAWPADESEWNELWRRKIKNEYLRMLLAREEEAAAATNSSAMLETAVTNAVAVEVDDRPVAPVEPPVEGGPVVEGEAPAAAEAPVEGESTASVEVEIPVLPEGVGVSNAAEGEAVAVVTNAPVALPSIESVISNRYRQAWMVIEDSDEESVLQRHLNAFAQAYDPHSSFMTPGAWEDFQIEMNLALFGIGALLSAEDGAAKIESLIPGGPAERDTREKRLQPGDKIIAVAQDDGEMVDVLHWPLNKIVKRIRGEKGTRVVLTVIPVTDPSGTLTKTVDLVRDEVKLEERAASGTIRALGDADGVTNRLGVIKLPAFYANMSARSPEDPGFRSAVHDVLQILNSQKLERVEGVLLDLRGNGGGALVEAIDMTGLFIRRGPTVQVKERFSLRALDDQDPRIYYEGPLVVLVNRLSASASEIVAGALQDYGRAIIVGDSKTHGKGTVQSLLDLGSDKDMGRLKVTTASYIRVSGASTQKQGVAPDIIVPSPWDFMDTGEEFLPNVMPESMESPARYQPVADLSSMIPLLRERSEQRRRQDAQFQAYARMLERLAHLNEEKVLSLNLEARRELAQAERELAELQERLAAAEAQVPSEDEQDADADTPVVSDPVLTEALQILSDLVALRRVDGREFPSLRVRELAELMRGQP